MFSFVFLTQTMLNLSRARELPDNRRAFVVNGDTSLYELARNGNRHARQRFGLAALLKGVASGNQLLLPAGIPGHDRALARLSGAVVVASDLELTLTQDEAGMAQREACRTLGGPIKFQEERYAKVFLLCDSSADAFGVHVYQDQLFILPLNGLSGYGK